MNILGRLFLLITLSVGVLNASEISKVFSLQDQEFADVTSNKLQKYKINENLILSMKMSKVDYLDGYQGLSKPSKYNSSNFLKAVFINPYLKNWVYNEAITLNMGDSYFYREKNPSSLKFYDENGMVLSLNFKAGKICAGDKCLSSGFKGYRAFNIKIVNVNGTITFSVNDKKIYSSKKRFSKLKSIEHTFFAYTSDGISDTLADFTLSEIK